MRIWAPQGDAEFMPVLGDLTEEQLAVVERNLKAAVPDVRFIRVQDGTWIPAVRRFTIKVHREDRERASPVISATTRALSPMLLRRRAIREERDVAALVRQYVRATGDGDPVAADVTLGLLCQRLEWMLEALLHEEPLRTSVRIWLDGIGSQCVTIAPPFGLTILGSIYCGAAREPFAAELATSRTAPALDSLLVRFGRLEALSEQGVFQGELPDVLLDGSGGYRARVGVVAAYGGGAPLTWAFEFTKADRPGSEP